MNSAATVERTTPPGRYVVLYDGHCKFCTAGARQLAGLARRGALDLVSFQEPGALDPFPGLTHAACMRQMYLVTPEGRVHGGAAAVAEALATRPALRRLARAYYLPGVRQLCDAVYRLIAANRYRLLGKSVTAGGCQGGTCALHFGGRGRPPLQIGRRRVLLIGSGWRPPARARRGGGPCSFHERSAS